MAHLLLLLQVEGTHGSLDSVGESSDVQVAPRQDELVVEWLCCPLRALLGNQRLDEFACLTLAIVQRRCWLTHDDSVWRKVVLAERDQHGEHGVACPKELSTATRPPWTLTSSIVSASPMPVPS